MKSILFIPVFDSTVQLKHYENTPMHHTAIFHGFKYVNFQMKNYNIFLILLKTLIVGTHKNRLIEAVLMSSHNQCFRANIRKIYTPVNPSFIM